MKLILILLSTIFVSSLAKKLRFDNYRVVGFDVENRNQEELWHNIEAQHRDYDFWSRAKIGRETSVMVPPNKFADFSRLATMTNTTFRLKIDNVQALIESQLVQRHANAFDWTSYATWEQIYQWLDQQVEKHPKILTNYVIGNSFENRPIRAVRISYKENNPVLFLEANIHAREWISSATATWLINELLTSTDPKVRDAAENIDWVIIPILNIDGFAYSHSEDRMWRKTRQPNAEGCIGTDPNRNFDAHWNTVGTSNDPCANNYAGPQPFSEPEAIAYASFFEKFSNQTKIIISFHSYGQYLMWPRGYTKDPIENDESLNGIAQKTVEAIASRYGTDYLYGSSSVILYETSGSNIDWAYDKFGIKLAFIFELRDLRNGDYGFMLPTEQIIPNCLEVLDGLVALIEEARALKQL